MNKKLCLSLLCIAAAATQVRADTTLVFNEIMYHPATNEPALEWIEFYNQLAVDLDISDWRISGDINFKFPVGTRAPGRGFIVLAANPAALMAATGLTNVFGPVTNRLSNSGGTIEIRNNSDRVVDHISFGVDGEWPVTPDGSGVSLAKRDRDFGSAKASSWTQSAQIGGTPGADNFPPGLNAKLISIDAAWKYDASGTDLGTVWRGITYNDSTWSSRVGLTNRAIPTLFNTGVDDNRVVIPPGGTDPHYILAAGAQGTPGANAIAILNHPNWLANDSVSSFIGVVTPGATTINGGGYDFQTTFSLTGFLPSTARININVAVDNDLTNVFINGVPSGLTTSGFAAFNPTLTLAGGFLAGANTLEFRTVNQGAGPGGFRATLNGTALAPADAPLPSGNSTYYFRKSFNFGGNPKFTTLTLNPVAADGAVFYLNGVEVYRQNLPSGSIAYSTAALSNVSAINYSGPIIISGSNLVLGANVLAVEVHQATGSTDGPVFGTELAYSESAGSPLTVAFNEVSATTNASFWLELMNYGTNAIPLDGYVITRDIQGTNVAANYVIPSGTTIQPGGFLVLSNSVLGFIPSSGDKLFLFAPNKANVVAGVIARNGPRARFPNGTGDWLIPNAPAPGAANSFAFHNEIVINEIMYNHKAFPPVSANIPPKDNPEAWLELYNRSSNSVNLTGWELGGGVSYKFAAGKTIPANGYLVVADNASDLRAKYPSLDIVGNLGGRLSHSDDHIVLRDPVGNPADEVHYYNDGRWPIYPAGGGSSLELRDPNSDNSKAEAWASSDESGRSSWQTYTYRIVAQRTPNNNTTSPDALDSQWRDFIFGLQSAGECLIDDLSVVELPTSAPAQIIANGDFESGLTGWRAIGTHGRTRVETDPANPGNHVLHVIATGAQEHLHNHIETTLLAGKTIVNAREYEVSFRARWLAGNHLLNTRLYFNRIGRTTVLSYPQSNGTPGARNSTYVANAGPTFSDFGHQPIVPAGGEPVTVSAIAQDPQGVASARVFWSVNSGAWSNAPMTGLSGRYTGTIPGQSTGAVVQFYIEATDTLGAAATFPARGPNSGALYKVQDGLADLPLAHNVRVILTPDNINLLHGNSQGVNQTNVMSNDLLPCTIIYDERRAYYDCGTHLRGSQRGRYSDIRTGFHLEFQPDDLFRGVHPVMSIDRSGQGDSAVNRQEEVVIRHILNRAGGIPGAYTEIARLLAPRAAHTGSVQFFPRQEDVLAETAFENGGDGTFYEMELIYYPTTANAAGYKNPQPDTVVGLDVTDLGDDKELYRYNFIIKNHRDADDYSRFVALGKAWALPAGSAALDAATRQLMDIDEWMRSYALISLCSVGDMYGFGNNHNFLMYIRPSDGKFIYFPTDMDFAFSRGPTGVLVGDQNLAKVVNLPGNLRRLYAHMLDIISTSFNTNYMASWMAHYASFAPGQNYSGLGTASPGNSLGIMAARVPFVLSQISAAQGGNTNFNVGATNIFASNNLVAVTGTAPVQVSTITINGNPYPITWTSVTAWRINVPVSEASTTLNVLARDYSGNVISNSSRTITVTYTNALPPDPRGVIVFNEIMFNPLVPDSAYIELFNTSSNFTFDLSGWEINGLGFTFPNGSIITNRQYLVIAANAAAYVAAYGTGAGTPVAEFSGNLQNDGETLTLIKPAATTNGVATVVDKIRYESNAPWPTVANGTGSSIQLIDASQDNSRPLNWFSFHMPSIAYPAVTNVGWQFRSITALGNANGLRLLMFIDSVGELYVDDISLVDGTNAAIGANYVRNGDFESPLYEDPPLTNTWTIPTNYTNTAISPQLVHSGNGSLRMLCSTAGSSLTRILIQNLSPAPTNNLQNYTLAFWFYATNTASNLVVRVLNTGLNSQNVNTRPTVDAASNTVPIVALSPGAPNQQTTNLAPIPPLWINELQADNVSGIQDNNGQRDPWIELYNSGTSGVSLDGLYLSGNYTNLTNWAFPAGRSIGAGQFMVIFCDAQPAQTTATQLHTSFRLTSGSGSIALSRLENSVPRVLDYVNYSGVHSNNSYGSIPDGQQFERREFAFPTPGGTNDGRSAPLRVFINEWMAGNTNGITDPADGANDDWFELYNPSDTAVDLTGYFLTDNLADKFQYLITTNGAHTIPARGFLLVWADGETGQNTSGGVARSDLHVNFRLAQTGEAIGLFAADGTQIDAITFTNQTDDVSQGRFPDGSTNIVLTPNSATPRAANRVDSAGPPIQFSSPTLNGNNFILTWSTTAGKTYRVEYKNDLGAANWLTLGNDVVATGNMLSMTNSITNSPQRFFRIRQL